MNLWILLIIFVLVLYPLISLQYRNYKRDQEEDIDRGFVWHDGRHVGKPHFLMELILALIWIFYIILSVASKSDREDDSLTRLMESPHLIVVLVLITVMFFGFWLGERKKKSKR